MGAIIFMNSAILMHCWLKKSFVPRTWCTYVFSYLRGNITAKYWSKPISRVPTIDALETQDDTNSLKRHRIGWLRLVCILGHSPNGIISMHIKGIRIKVEKRLTTNRFPTNLKGKENVYKQVCLLLDCEYYISLHRYMSTSCMYWSYHPT